jgi:hypothetical protein
MLVARLDRKLEDTDGEGVTWAVFGVCHLGEATYFLGMEVTRD